jgi:hypothetical protein
MEGMMELLQFDAENYDLVIKMDVDELNHLSSLVGGVCATGHEQDFTILGVTEERANELRTLLYQLLETTNKLLQLKNGR